MTLKNYKSQVLKDPKSHKLNFTPDGREHSVYRITHKIKLEHYYGSKSNNRVLGESYKSSSSDTEFINEQKTHPELFKYKIIKTYNNTADKIIHEAYLHQRFNVKSHNKFYNGANQTPFGFDTTGIGFPHSESTKLKISESRKGVSSWNKGKSWDIETKLKIGLGGIGRKIVHTNKTKQQISKTKKKQLSDPSYKEIVLKKRKYTFEANASNNYRHIGIFSPDGQLQHYCNENFNEFLSNHDLPRVFIDSLRKGITLYDNPSSHVLKRLQNNGNEKFIGWWAEEI